MAQKAARQRRVEPEPAVRTPLTALLNRPWLTVVLVVVAAAPRLWIAWFDQGIVWPDEIYQSVESAHRVAFGYGFTPWEFDEGARSYLFPGLIAGVWKVCDLVGLDTGLALMRIAKLLVVAGALAGIVLAVRMARELAGNAAALITVGLTIAYPLCLLYGTRTFSEAVAAPLILAAVAATIPAWQRPHLVLLAGAAGGAATTLRPQNAIVVVIVLVGLLLLRQSATAARYAAGAAAAFGLGGLLDWTTWGTPFASTWRILEYNLVDEGRADYGSQSTDFYVRTLATGTGPVLILVVIGMVAAARKAPIPTAAVVGYLVVHSVVPHKELRFLYPVIPLALVLAGVGLALLIERFVGGGRLAVHAERTARAAGAVAATGIALSLAWLPAMTFDRIGEENRGITQTQSSVWSHSEGFNALLSEAGRRDNACGVAVLSRIPDQWIIFLGGYSYLHRDVPLFNVYADEMTAGNRNLAGANVLIAAAGESVPPEFQPAAHADGVDLYVRPGSCLAVPDDYSTHFPK